MLRTLRLPILVVLPLLLSLWFSACSKSTEPVADIGDRSEVQGSGTVDPSAGTFVLKTFDNPPPGGGTNVRVQLIGSNMVVLPDSGIVSIDVALRNLHPEALYGPAIVWLSDLTPADLSVLNPDLVMHSDSTSIAGLAQFGFDYTAFFGDDGFLGSQETSESKTWSFGNHNGNSFSFAARAEFGMVPDLPRIAGFCWMDGNRNGFPEPGEQHVEFGFVNVRFPQGHFAGVMVGPDGHYSVPVTEAGLYELHFDPMIDTFVPLGFTTPNPLEVLLVPAADGQPNSFIDANFGMINDVPLWHAIQFTDLSPDSLQIGNYELIDAVLGSPVSLDMHVAFSGCGPDESFSLFMSGGFMESYPVQANLVLRKDWQSDCDAIWESDKHFDLSPLIDRFVSHYGAGTLLLNIFDFSGDVRQLELNLYPHDGEGDLAGVN